jgi:putative holliday junction resolvase
MTIVAIDYGKRRIGIAAADPGGILVYPVATLERTSLKRDMETLKAHLTDLEATKIIVGLPLNMDGSRGAAAQAAETFAANLHDATGLPLELYDERLTTFEAEQRLKESASRRGRKRHLDAVAATVILESWLRRSNKVA